MTSATSSLSRGVRFQRIYLWSLKKNTGMMILFALLLFLANPMILLASLPGWMSGNIAAWPTESKLQAVSRLYTNFVGGVAPALAVALVLLFALVLCVRLFGYMQNKRSVDLFHALPVERTLMLLGHWCAGMTVIGIPLVLDFLSLHFIGLAYGLSITDGRALPVYLALWALLMAAAAFTLCMFMAVCSGTTMDTVLSVLGVNAGYPLLLLSAYAVAGMLLPGYAVNIADSTAELTAFAPFPAAFTAVLKPHSVWFAFWWIAMTVLLLVGSVLLYRRRRSETAEDNFAFPIPKNVIRFLLTGVGGLGFGLVLNEIGAGGFFTGVLAGSAAAHLIVEAIYSRGFRHLKKSLIWYAGFAVVFVLFYSVLCTGFFGYDTRVPDASRVESVTVDPDIYWSGTGTQIINDGSHQRIAALVPTLREEKSIQTAIDAQKQIIESYRTQFPYQLKTGTGSGLTLVYRMKDGSVLRRTYQSYSVDPGNLFQIVEPAYEKLGTLQEFNESRDLIFYLQPGDIKNVDIDRDKKDSRTFTPDSATAAKLQQALEQDFLDGKVNRYRVNEEEAAGAVWGVHLEFRENLEPADQRLKALLGGYQGPINLDGGSYQFADQSSQTWMLLKQLGYVS